MRPLQELNELVLEKYKNHDHTWCTICICLFVKYELDLTEEEDELWYNNFLKYKPAGIENPEGPWWEWQENTTKGIDTRIQILTQIVNVEKIKQLIG